MIHKRRGGGLGWNWLSLAVGVACIALVVAAGAIEFEVSPIALVRLLVGAVVGLAILRRVTRRSSAAAR